MILDFAAVGRSVTAEQASRAVRQGETDVYEGFLIAMAGFDANGHPTTPIPAQPHFGDYGPTAVIEGQEVPPLGVFLHPMTEPPSHASRPAISVLCGFTNEGLPIGAQFIGPVYADAFTASLVARYERAATWHTFGPPL